MPLRIAGLDGLLPSLRRAPPPSPADADADGTNTATPPRRNAHHRPHHHRPKQQHQHPARQPRKPRPPGFGPPDDARSFFWGTLTFGALAYVAGAAPWALHLVFLAFFFVVLPLRAVSFWRRKWQFFLIDYCYFAAAAAALFLLFLPDDPRAEAAAYALTEGPLAAALAAWQCRLQFGSLEHTVSTHLHLLPGLAVVAHRYAAPSGVRGWRAIAGHLRATAAEAAEAAMAGGRARAQTRPARERSWSPWTGTVTAEAASAAAPPIFRLFRPPDGPLPSAPPQLARPVLQWAVAAPLAFYCAWQLAYYAIVQVACRQFILREGYDTSYTCLARRAQKSNNVWNRIVRKGSPLRRCAAYGALQLAFTVASVVGLALPAYVLGPRAGALVQVLKVAVPLWYGARWQCEFGAPKHAFDAGARWARQQQGQQQGQENGRGEEEDGEGEEEGRDGGAGGLERALSDGVLMAAGLGSGDGALDAIAGGGDGDDGDEATSGPPLRRGPSGRAGRRAAAAFGPVREEQEEGGGERQQQQQQQGAVATRAWGGGPSSSSWWLTQRRPRR